MTAWSLCRRETRACVVPSQQQELWWAACGTGSGIYFRNCALCQAWKKPANLNKMFVFAEKHPASATLTNAVFGQDTLSETSLQSHCSSTYNSHKLTEKMKTLLEGVCGGGCLFVSCLEFLDFWWWFWVLGLSIFFLYFFLLGSCLRMHLWMSFLIIWNVSDRKRKDSGSHMSSRYQNILWFFIFFSISFSFTHVPTMSYSAVKTLKPVLGSSCAYCAPWSLHWPCNVGKGRCCHIWSHYQSN